ncbi:MAG TPA: hypothetical protein VJN90_07715 [Candidatus Acidoferrales bacterium]|nr:hypothetical protein [Candidatus Acidoferrales bacterium]
MFRANGKCRMVINGAVWLSFAFFAITAISTGAHVSAAAQSSNLKAKPKGGASVSGKLNAQQLAREVLANELRAEQSDNTLWRFSKLTEKDGKKELQDVIETKHGEVGRLLAVNGKRLNAEQQSAENARIKKLLADPDAQKQAAQTQKEDDDKEAKLLEMLPDALLYTYAGRKGSVVKLTFKPNPKFHASSHEAEVFHHMAGIMLLDTSVKRLAQMKGTLTSEVKFGGGILGHLDKGGTFEVRLGRVARGHWDMTFLETELTGKALFFKTIAVREKTVESNYRRVAPDITVQQAAQMLQKGTAEAATVVSRKTTAN